MFDAFDGLDVSQDTEGLPLLFTEGGFDFSVKPEFLALPPNNKEFEAIVRKIAEATGYIDIESFLRGKRDDDDIAVNFDYFDPTQVLFGGEDLEGRLEKIGDETSALNYLRNIRAASEYFVVGFALDLQLYKIYDKRKSPNGY